MKLDRRLTNGLAWAGALLVVGVPAADYLAGRFGADDVPRAAVVETQDAIPAAPIPASEPSAAPVETAAVPVAAAPRPAPVKTAAAETPARSPDAVQSFLDSGRALPSYITGGGAQPQAVVKTQPPATPAPSPTAVVTPPAPAVAPPVVPSETVAALPAKIAPVPMPLSMRPRPVVSVAPQAPLIVNEPAPVIVNDPGPLVTADDLEGWETGPLSDFLAQRQQRGSSAVYRVQPNQNSYESDGFWLDELPSDNRPQRFPPAYDDGYYAPFSR